MFKSELMNTLTSTFPDDSLMKLNEKAVDKWDNLTDEERKAFQDSYDAKSTQYEEDLKEWNDKNPHTVSS